MFCPAFGALGYEFLDRTRLQIYLIGGLEHFLFSHILNIIIPIDFHIFQRVSKNHQPDTLKKMGEFLPFLPRPQRFPYRFRTSILQDPHPAVRARAANALAEMGDTEAPIFGFRIAPRFLCIRIWNHVYIVIL